MTRRKRTPPPPPAAPGAGAAGTYTTNENRGLFKIPASLQHLSTLSARLARSDDVDGDDDHDRLPTRTDSEMVRAAQERAALSAVDVPPPGGGGRGGRGGRGRGQEGARGSGGKTKGRRYVLKWKTNQNAFPDQQTWITPKAGAAAQGHATFMQRRFKEGQAGGKIDSAGLLTLPPPTTGRAVQSQPVMGAGGSMSRQANAPLRASTDDRVRILPSWPPAAPPPPPPPGTNAPADAFSSWQPSDPDTTTAAAPPTQGDGGPPRKKQRVEFIERHQRSFPAEQTWVRVQTRVARHGGSVAGAGGANPAAVGFSSDIEARRSAIIAQLRRTHRPAVILGVDDVEEEKDGYDYGDAGSGGTGGQHATAPPPPPPPPIVHGGTQAQTAAAAAQSTRTTSGTAAAAEHKQSLELGKHQREIAALIALKRAQNAASGQARRLAGLQSDYQRSRAQGYASGGGVGSLDGSDSSAPLHGQQSTAGRRGPLIAPRPVPLQGLAEAAQAMMAGRPVGDGGHSAGDGAGGGEDTDEDAPGEEDTPDPPLPSAVSAAGDTVLLPSIEDGRGGPGGGQVVPAAAGNVHALNTDPGDLRSLFSSPGPSTPMALGTGQPPSPSAQLLMALANAGGGGVESPHRRTRGGIGARV